MKNIISLLVFMIISVTTSVGQNNVNFKKTDSVLLDVERKVLMVVNQYRSSKNLGELSWSKDLYLAASHHSFYMSNIAGISHEETEDISNFTEIQHLNDRVMNYSSTGYFSISELVSCNFNNKNLSTEKGRLDLANNIVLTWISSKPHNESLINPKFTTFAASVYFSNDFGVTIKSTLVLRQ